MKEIFRGTTLSVSEGNTDFCAFCGLSCKGRTLSIMGEYLKDRKVDIGPVCDGCFKELKDDIEGAYKAVLKSSAR